MRLIGNKIRLLGDIETFLRDRGVLGGTFLDVFCGTANVARHFKTLGFRVIANDHLSLCYTRAVAGIEVSSHPSFDGLKKRYADTFHSSRFQETFFQQLSFAFESDPAQRKRREDLTALLPLAEAIHFLSHHVEPEEGLVFRNYCPGGPHGRMYFTDENGKRADGMLRFLRESHRNGDLTHHELHLLLSSVLDAVDKVANISGTYGAYLKKWQPNALQPLQLRVPEILVSPLSHQAWQEDANALVRRVKADVLYIDPPYNTRQYPANYHILEIMAEHHKVDDLKAYEAGLYGKTGLRPYKELKSVYCVRPSRRSTGENVLSALTDLILSSHVQHVIVSYNEEGLLTREEIGAVLSRFSGTRAFDFSRNMRSVLFKRFRSDSDRGPGDPRGKRLYKVLEGKERNEIHEWLFYAARSRARTGARKVFQETT